MRARLVKSARFMHLDGPEDGAQIAGHIALVPGRAVPLLALHLPDGLQGGAREQVAWRQLQDQLGVTAKQVEMRPYCGGNAINSWDRVLLVAADQMQRWRHRLDPGCRALLPDYLALPAGADLWVVERQEDGVRARLGRQDGFSAEVDLALVMLQQALADPEAPRPKALLLLGGDWPDLSALLSEENLTLLRDTKALAALGLQAPVVLGHGELAADLRIDGRAARHQLRVALRPWLAAALAGVLMAGIWAGSEAVKIRQLQRDRSAVQAHIETLARAHFVPAGPLLDLRLQVSQALAARQAEVSAGAGRVSPLLLMGQVADVLVAAGLQPDLLTYGPAAGLVLELKLADFAALDLLVAALDQSGIAADPQGARVASDGAGVRVALHLQVKPSAGGDQ